MRRLMLFKKNLFLINLSFLAFGMENELTDKIQALKISAEAPLRRISGSVRLWVDISDTEKVSLYFNKTEDGKTNLTGQIVTKAQLQIPRPIVRNLKQEEAQKYWNQYITLLLPKAKT